MAVPTVKLNNGYEIPALGLGTFQAGFDEAVDVIKKAIDIGYRHFDCAMAYGNEKEIGIGLRSKIDDGTVKREELFITSKIWNNKHDPDCVVDTVKKSLSDFGLDYLDLMLIHWPCGFKNVEYSGFFPPGIEKLFSDVDYVDTYKALEECVKLGLVKSIGISNFNSEQVDRVYKAATIKPVVNQVEVSPIINQRKLIKFCKERQIKIVAYSPLGALKRSWAKPTDPEVPLKHADVIEIGKKYNKSAAQVILRYLIQLGVIPIPKSANEKRLKENINVFDFEIDEEDAYFLNSFNCDGRTCPASEMSTHKYYPFNIPF